MTTSTTAYCKVHDAVHEVVSFIRMDRVNQTEVPSWCVRGHLDCGHTASLVMSETNLEAVTTRKAKV